MFICVDSSSFSFLSNLFGCISFMPAYLTCIWYWMFSAATCRCEVRHQIHRSSSLRRTVDIPFIHFQPSYKCLYMKRGEKPEGYRQMRPKTFPGNSQQRLEVIRNSLCNLSKTSEPPKVDPGGQAKMLPEEPRQQGRTSTPKHKHHKALQAIRNSLEPFERNGSSSKESKASGSDFNKQMSLDTPSAGFEEVRYVPLCSHHTTTCEELRRFHSVHTSVIEVND